MSMKVFPGADEATPSRSQYFSWINHTNEGPTEAQTLANLAFFKYLHDEFGMVLDIYAFDAGAVDGAKFYGSTESERFRRQFPRGFGPVYAAAKSMGTRLGIWGGPDGFGDRAEQAQKRTEMMVSFCRDYEFALFKFDGVCGELPEENRRHFVEMMKQCRVHSPDLILLNHRLKLGDEGMKHATTFLWEGNETYIDALMVNTECATHNRGAALSRGLPPDLKRLCEDHGVCLSSCLDYWEDELVLQAFNRCLILAPELYGSPWLLRDDELPKLARIYNLHRRYRDILVKGMVLPAERFGPHAVSRGDAETRLITLRNLTWEPVRYSVALDGTIGLGGNGAVTLRRLHPHECDLGKHAMGATVDVEVLPFRTCLLVASIKAIEEIAVRGCAYEVVRNVPGQPVVIDLLGMPGTRANVELPDGEKRRVDFGGTALKTSWHRKIADMTPTEVPADAEALYEATCFAADSNALEVRELGRSGPTQIPEVQAARDAFFSQPTFRRRFLWDRFLFDDDADTAFAVCRRWSDVPDVRVRRGAFRLDFGQAIQIDRLLLECGHDQFLAPFKSEEGVRCEVSADLRTWRTFIGFASTNIEVHIAGDEPIRYVRFEGTPELVRHVRGYRRGVALQRSKWRASNLFAQYRTAVAKHAWSATFTLEEVAPGAYLALAMHGPHGSELAHVGVRTVKGYMGAARRAPSFYSNTWEVPVRPTEGNHTFFFPLTQEHLGVPMEAFAFVLNGGNEEVQPKLWLTAYPIPLVRQRITLSR